MNRPLIVFNTILGILCLALGLGTGRALLLKRPLPEPTGWRASSASSPPALSGPGQTSGAEHGAIIARNVFNPSRSEAGGVTPLAARPYLHGVVVDGTRSRAFLEEPLARRVRGYSVGDEMMGGRIQEIAGDRVIIARPEGLLEVLLQDPAKPRGVAPAAAAPSPSPPSSQVAPPSPPPGVVSFQPSPVPFVPRGRALGLGRPGNE